MHVHVVCKCIKMQGWKCDMVKGWGLYGRGKLSSYRCFGHVPPDPAIHWYLHKRLKQLWYEHSQSYGNMRQSTKLPNIFHLNQTPHQEAWAFCQDCHVYASWLPMMSNPGCVVVTVSPLHRAPSGWYGLIMMVHNHSLCMDSHVGPFRYRNQQ